VDIDSLHHPWHWQKYPWLAAPMTPKISDADYSDLRQDYLVEDLRADFGDHNVVKSVLVQANDDPAKPVEETTWLQSQAFPPCQRRLRDHDYPDQQLQRLALVTPKTVRILGVAHSVHAA
jgi:predicted TIM-barrel fold metal-dependent hydrolase